MRITTCLFFVFVSLLLVLLQTQTKRNQHFIKPSQKLRVEAEPVRCTVLIECHYKSQSGTSLVSECRLCTQQGFCNFGNKFLVGLITETSTGLRLTVCPICGTPEGSGAHQSLFTTRLLFTLLCFRFYTCFTYDTKEK